MQQEQLRLQQTIQQQQAVNNRQCVSTQQLHQLLPSYNNRGNRYRNSGVSGTGLPAGVSATWAGNTITISGTPTASGTFAYSILLTGGCGTVNATGTIIVTANNTAAGASVLNQHFVSVQQFTKYYHHNNRGNRYFSGVSNGLPAGVSCYMGSNTITISGTPTASGTFDYSILLTGGCGTVNATGTIIVTANNTAAAA